jgi:hypothetical protein
VAPSLYGLGDAPPNVLQIYCTGGGRCRGKAPEAPGGGKEAKPVESVDRSEDEA